MPRLRSAPNAMLSPPRAQRKTRQALKEKTNVTCSKGTAPVYDNDGHTEGLVKNAGSRKRIVENVLSNEDGMFMAGGLGLLETPHEDAPSRGLEIATEELAKDDAPLSKDTRSNHRPTRVVKRIVDNVAQRKTMESRKQQITAMIGQDIITKGVKPATSGASISSPGAGLRRSPSGFELSELSLSPSPRLSSRLSAMKNGRLSLMQQGSALLHNTPAADVSTLALKHFRRRPRQPSMLQLVQQHVANTTMPALQPQGHGDYEIDDMVPGNNEDGVEDDFAPDAEGTPVQIKQTRREPGGLTNRSAAGTRKRSIEAAEQSYTPSGTAGAKRRKSNLEEIDDEPVDEFPQGSVALPSSPGDQTSVELQTTSDVQVVNSSPSSTPLTESLSPDARHGHDELDTVIPSTEEQQDDGLRQDREWDDENAEQVPSGTMAEPASSSPAPAISAKPSTRTAKAVAQGLDARSSTVPMRRAKSKAKPLSSAALQSLLPKRRQQRQPRARRSEYDLLDSDDDSAHEDDQLSDREDELSIVRGKRRAKLNPSPATKTKPRKSKVTSAKMKTSAAPGRSVTTTAKTNVKTYGRVSDKENDVYNSELGDQDDSTIALPEMSMYEATQSKELEEMKRKFAEIDALEMEFETIDNEEHRSSSLQWR